MIKESSVVQLLIENQELEDQVSKWFLDWPDATTVVGSKHELYGDIQLVIMDWVAYSQTDLINQLNAIDCPWVVISDQPSTQQELQVLAEGGADYLRLPIDQAVSRLRLKIHLNRKRTIDRLESLSITDTLTGLFNRRKYDYEMKQCWKQALRHASPCSLLIVDIDLFKNYNDLYGHLVGDRCLQAVANTLQTCASRPRDLAARIGGEEFALLLPETPNYGAKHISDRLLANIRGLNIPHAESESGIVTVSVGLATVYPSNNLNLHQWHQLADDALYQAKHDGRNRIHSIAVAAKKVAST